MIYSPGIVPRVKIANEVRMHAVTRHSIIAYLIGAAEMRFKQTSFRVFCYARRLQVNPPLWHTNCAIQDDKQCFITLNRL